MRKSLFLILFLIPSLCFGYGDEPPDKDTKIKVEDFSTWFDSASKPTVSSALRQLAASYPIVSAGLVSDTIYGASWNGITLYAPSKNAVYDKIETIGGQTPWLTDIDGGGYNLSNVTSITSNTVVSTTLKVGTLGGLLKGTSGTVSAITDSSTNWDTAYTNRITSATAPTPLTLTIAGNTISASILQAQTGVSGYLTSSDWNTFNNKAAYSFGANNFNGSGKITTTGSGTFGQLQVDGNANIAGDLYVTDVFVTNAAGESYVLGNFGIGNSAPGFMLRVGTSPGQGLLVVKADGSVGIGTTAPTQKLRVVGDILADTIGTTTLNVTGVSNLNNIATGTWSGDILAIGKIPTIPLETKVSGTLPLVNTALIPLTTQVSGTLPLANTPLIPLTTQVSGTLPAANMTVVDLASGMVSGTLPLANILTIPLATKTSGTLPDASAPVNIVNNSTTSNTGVFTQLMIAGTNSATTLKSAQFLLAGTDISNNLKSGTVTATNLIIAGTPSSTQLTTNTLRTGDTIPLMRLNVLNTAVGTLPGATLHINKAYLIDKMYAQIIGVGATNVIFTLRQNSADGTTPLYNLSAGQTAVTGLLTVTSFTGGSVPAGNLLVVDITAVNGSATSPSFRLEIFGHES